MKRSGFLLGVREGICSYVYSAGKEDSLGEEKEDLCDLYCRYGGNSDRIN